jgi:CheY-like chemotaxis protein
MDKGGQAGQGYDVFRSARVLVVDDDVSVGRATVRLLRGAGLDPVLVHTPDAALVELELDACGFFCIVTDYDFGPDQEHGARLLDRCRLIPIRPPQLREFMAGHVRRSLARSASPTR